MLLEREDDKGKGKAEVKVKEKLSKCNLIQECFVGVLIEMLE